MQPIVLTNSVSGGGGVCVATMFGNIIEVKMSVATDATRAYATIETPIPFRIVGVNVIGATLTGGAGSAGADVGVRNDDAVIVTGLQISTDNTNKFMSGYLFARTNGIFAKDDNDLVVTVSGTSTSVVVAVLHILPM